MTPREIERIFQRQANRLSYELTRSVRDTAREGLAVAKQDSSGKWNKRRRQKAGYSYSRFDPNPPPQPLGVINIETGIFLAAWHVLPVRTEGRDSIAAYVINDSDRVKDLVDARGKPWLSRPIDRRIIARLTPVFQYNVERALSRALKG